MDDVCLFVVYFSSNNQANSSFLRTKQTNMIFLGSFHRVQAPYFWNLLKSRNSVDYRCRFNDLIDEPFLALFRKFQVLCFSGEYYRKSMHADTEMKQILRSNLGIVK